MAVGLVYSLSCMLFRMSLAMDVRCATFSVRLLPEDDRMIEICRSILSVLMRILDH